MKRVNNLEMFKPAFVMSSLSFGGGYITIPMLRRQFVTKKKLITEDKLQDLAAIAQSSPGSISVSLASGVAYEIGGLNTMLVSFIGSVLPPLLILSVITIFYDSFIQNSIVQSIFSGLEIGVAVIMVLLVKDMIAQLYQRDHKQAVGLLIMSMFLNYLFKTHVVFILLFNLGSVFMLHHYQVSS